MSYEPTLSAQEIHNLELENYFNEDETEEAATQAEALRRLRARRASMGQLAPTSDLSQSPSDMQQPMASTSEDNLNLPE